MMTMPRSNPNDESAPPAGGNNHHTPKKNDGGSVHPWELILVSVLVMAMIGGAAAAIVLATRGDPLPPGTGLDPVTGKLVSLLPVPPPPTLFADDAAEYEFLITELKARGAPFASIVETLAATSLPDLAVTATDRTDPLVRAAVWLTTTDTTNAQEFAVTRFVLASIYYSMGGDDWSDNSNWLSPTKNHCDWYGVECCPELLASTSCSYTDFYKLVQIDLFRNNLAGPLPISVGLLSDLQSIFMNENRINGTFPTQLGELSQLHRLYLQHNLFSGRIPSKAELDKGGNIDTLMLHGNNFSGNFTADWCKDTCIVCNTLGLAELGLDCDKILCEDTSCCKEWENCFYNSQLGTA
jgi:hypothetical protein